MPACLFPLKVSLPPSQAWYWGAPCRCLWGRSPGRGVCGKATAGLHWYSRCCRCCPALWSLKGFHLDV